MRFSARLRVLFGALAAIALMVAGGVAQAPHAQARSATDFITTKPGETLRCAFARHALNSYMPKRAPASLLEALVAEEAAACAMTTEQVEQWDGSMKEKVTMVDLPVEIPTNWRAEQMRLVNDTRAKHGREPLRRCARLDDAAQKYAQMMADTGHYGHTGPDGSTPTKRAQQAGYRVGAGENIAYGYRSNADVMEGWIRSTGHYRNILLKRYEDAGFGAAQAEDGKIYWVQMFGLGAKCKARQ